MKLTRNPSSKIDVSGWQIPSVDKAEEAVKRAYGEILSECIEMLFSTDDACVNFAGSADTLHFCFPYLTNTGDDVVFQASITEIINDAIASDDIEVLIPLCDTFRQITKRLEMATARK